jgi:hypothetical protein
MNMHIICIYQMHIKQHRLLQVKMANPRRLNWCILMCINVCVYMRRMFPAPFLVIAKCEHIKTDDEEEDAFAVPVTPHPSINEDRDWIQIQDTV